MRRHSDLLEPCAGKLASTVLRGEGDSNVPALPDYWSERNSMLYPGETSKALKKQNHSSGHCGFKMLSEEKVHLHHVDGNHNNWKTNNLLAIHESCHDYIHMSKGASQEYREPDETKVSRPDLTERGGR